MQSGGLHPCDELLEVRARPADDHPRDRQRDDLLDAEHRLLAADLVGRERSRHGISDARSLDGDDRLGQGLLDDAYGGPGSKVTACSTSSRAGTRSDGTVAADRRLVAIPSCRATDRVPRTPRPVASTTCAPAAMARRTAATTAGDTTSESDGTVVPSMSSAMRAGPQPGGQPKGEVRSALTTRSGARTSRPPTYGRSASGTRTEPSACWWFSRIATSQRVVASVPFSVATGALRPSATRERMSRRRAWNVVQFDVDVSSR